MGLFTATALRGLSSKGVTRLNNPTLAARSVSSGQGAETSKRAPSSMVWRVAPFVAAGATFLAVGSYFSDSSWRYEESETNNDAPSKPQAEITSRVYFDVSLDQVPAGRIVMGLYGNVVPKTAFNFESLCRGHQVGNGPKLAYEGSTFHRYVRLY